MEGGGPPTECQGPSGHCLHPFKYCGVDEAALIKPFTWLSLGILLGEGQARMITPQVLPPNKYSGHSRVCGVGRGEK